MKNELKSIKHIWTIICQQSLIDPISNNITLQNVTDEITITGKDQSGKMVFPPSGTMLPIMFQMVSLWKRVGNDTNQEISLEGKVEIVDPAGKITFTQIHTIKIEAGKSRARGIIQFGSFQITESGDYLIRLNAKEPKMKDFVEVAENYLTIRFAVENSALKK